MDSIQSVNALCKELVNDEGFDTFKTIIEEWEYDFESIIDDINDEQGGDIEDEIPNALFLKIKSLINKDSNIIQEAEIQRLKQRIQQEITNQNAINVIIAKVDDEKFSLDHIKNDIEDKDDSIIYDYLKEHQIEESIYIQLCEIVNTLNQTDNITPNKTDDSPKAADNARDISSKSQVTQQKTNNVTEATVPRLVKLTNLISKISDTNAAQCIIQKITEEQYSLDDIKDDIHDKDVSIIYDELQENNIANIDKIFTTFCNMANNIDDYQEIDDDYSTTSSNSTAIRYCHVAPIINSAKASQQSHVSEEFEEQKVIQPEMYREEFIDDEFNEKDSKLTKIISSLEGMQQSQCVNSSIPSKHDGYINSNKREVEDFKVNAEGNSISTVSKEELLNTSYGDSGSVTVGLMNLDDIHINSGMAEIKSNSRKNEIKLIEDAAGLNEEIVSLTKEKSDLFVQINDIKQNYEKEINSLKQTIDLLQKENKHLQERNEELQSMQSQQLQLNEDIQQDKKKPDDIDCHELEIKTSKSEIAQRDAQINMLKNSMNRNKSMVMQMFADYKENQISISQIDSEQSVIDKIGQQILGNNESSEHHSNNNSFDIDLDIHSDSSKNEDNSDVTDDDTYISSAVEELDDVLDTQLIHFYAAYNQYTLFKNQFLSDYFDGFTQNNPIKCPGNDDGNNSNQQRKSNDHNDNSRKSNNGNGSGNYPSSNNNNNNQSNNDGNNYNNNNNGDRDGRDGKDNDSNKRNDNSDNKTDKKKKNKKKAKQDDSEEDEKEDEIKMKHLYASPSTCCNHDKCATCSNIIAEQDKLINMMQNLLTSLEQQRKYHQSFQQLWHNTIQNGSKPNKKNKRKKSRTKHVNGIFGNNNDLSYDPIQCYRGKGNIEISKNLTEKIIPSEIKESITNVFGYLDKTIAIKAFNMQINIDETKNDEDQVIDLNVHNELDTKLYGVIEKQNSGKYKWKMTEKLFTSTAISQQFESSLLRQPFVLQMNCIDHIRRQLSESIIKGCKWQEIPIFNRKNNKYRMTLAITNEELNKKIQNIVSNGNKNDIFNLMPIVMFDSNGYHVEFVWIIEIDTNIGIGISLIYDEKKLETRITGIHLDKQYLLEQHELVSPQHMNECKCLNGFVSIIDDMRIGNPDLLHNKLKDYKKRYEMLKQIVYQFIDGKPTDNYKSLQLDAKIFMKNDNGTLKNHLLSPSQTPSITTFPSLSNPSSTALSTPSFATSIQYQHVSNLNGYDYNMNNNASLGLQNGVWYQSQQQFPPYMLDQNNMQHSIYYTYQ